MTLPRAELLIYILIALVVAVTVAGYILARR